MCKFVVTCNKGVQRNNAGPDVTSNVRKRSIRVYFQRIVSVLTLASYYKPAFNCELMEAQRTNRTIYLHLAHNMTPDNATLELNYALFVCDPTTLLMQRTIHRYIVL